MALTKVTYPMIEGAPANVLAFGADPTGTDDSTTAIQAALDSGGAIYFPSGDYKITSALNVTVQGTSISGTNITDCRIMQSTLDEAIFEIAVDDVEICNLSLDYSGTPTAGATVFNCTGANPYFHNFKINRCHQGLKLIGSIIGMFHDFKIYNFVSSGIYIDNSADLFFNNFIVDAITITNGSLGNIFINNFAEAICFNNGDVLNGFYSLQTAADVDVQGSVPAHNNFSNVYFDGSAQGCYLDKCYTTEFVNCWFSCGIDTPGYPGLNLRKTDALTFTNTRFNGCGSHGCNVSATASRTTFTSCQFLGNSRIAGSNVASGLFFAGNANNTTVLGCTFRNTYFAGTQKYGIEISNGCGQLTITNNNVQGNGTAGISLGSSLAGCVIDNNIGYNPVGGSVILVGASPFTYTAGPSPETIYISNGTVSLIVTQAVAAFTSTNKTVQLGPNESVQVTYSVIPDMIKVVH